MTASGKIYRLMISDPVSLKFDEWSHSSALRSAHASLGWKWCIVDWAIALAITHSNNFKKKLIRNDQGNIIRLLANIFHLTDNATKKEHICSKQNIVYDAMMAYVVEISIKLWHAYSIFSSLASFYQYVCMWESYRLLVSSTSMFLLYIFEFLVLNESQCIECAEFSFLSTCCTMLCPSHGNPLTSPMSSFFHCLYALFLHMFFFLLHQNIFLPVFLFKISLCLFSATGYPVLSDGEGSRETNSATWNWYRCRFFQPRFQIDRNRFFFFSKRSCIISNDSVG